MNAFLLAAEPTRAGRIGFRVGSTSGVVCRLGFVLGGGKGLSCEIKGTDPFFIFEIGVCPLY
jgi:hypothetical protein